MTSDQLLHMVTIAIGFGVKSAAPFLLTALALGFVIAVFQSATQIQEQTLTFVPKLIALGIVGVVLGPWLLAQANTAFNEILDYAVTTLVG